MSKIANLVASLCAEDDALRATVLSRIAGDDDAELVALRALLSNKKAKADASTAAMPTEEEFNTCPVRFRFRPATDDAQRPGDLDPAADDPSSDNVCEHILAKKAEGTATVDFDLMASFMKDSFVAAGVPEDEADVCADVLISADKRGVDSHGIGRLKPIYLDRMAAGIMSAQSPMMIVSQTSTTAVVDGKPAGCDLPGLGLYIGPKCMQLAINKAKAHGVGVVVVRNSTHYGHAAYYGLMAEADGCIGMTGTNARPSIAPTYGVEPMMGTNPLVFGIPTGDDFGFCIDCATSVQQRGKIEKWARDGQDTPAGAVIDVDGNQLTDSNLILERMIEKKAALTPLGGAGHAMSGYKGFGYAATIEILCAALQDNKFGHALADTYIDPATGEKKRQPSELGHFFIAIDVEKFTPLEKFKGTASAILQGFRDAKKDPQFGGRIYTAGEPEHLAWRHRSRHGGCPVPPPLQRQMEALRAAHPTLQAMPAYQKLPWEEQ